jgi:hypothetical protein
MKILDDSIDNLIVLLDEVTRAAPDGMRFLEPSSGVLKQAQSKRHHVIFGRRGSGKSSLLRKTKNEIENSNSLGIYIDVESLNENQYPDILILVLIEILQELLKKINQKFYFFQKLKLKKNLRQAIKQFNSLLLSEDFAQLERRTKSLKTSDSSIDIMIGSPAKLKVGESSTEEDENKEIFKRSKINILNRNISNIISLLKEVRTAMDKEFFLLIDDLYHIRKQNQPELLSFLHKIAKNNGIWLKIGTVRFRSDLYRVEEKPVGVKLGDDVSEIDLDLTLEKMNTTKKFLQTLASELISEKTIFKLDDLINPNAFDRLIIGSGGVSRDFINLFRQSLINARERLNQTPEHPKGPRISVEDVNEASGAYGSFKKEEFNKDSLDGQDTLNQIFAEIRSFCLDKANSNCFLLQQDSDDLRIDELVDLKLIHKIDPRVTVSKRQGKVYRAMMLDLSEYAGSRTIRKLETIDFWKPNEKEKLRRVGLIYQK